MLESPPPPGWYPDPAGDAAVRWWDGQAWSGDVRADPEPPPDAGRPRWAVPGGRAGHTPPLRPAGGGGRTAEPQPGEPGGRVIPARAAWWALAGILVGELLGGIVGGIAGAATGNANGAVPTLFGELGLWAGMLGSCVLVSRRYGSGSLRTDFRLRWRPVDLLVGLGAGLAGVIVTGVISAAFAGSRLSGTNTQMLTSEKGDGAGFVIVTLIAALGAPFFEELFFRGLIRTALSARLGPIGAIWAQAALFGLAHYEPVNGLGNVSVMVAIGAFGVILGYTAHRTRRLGAGMVAHAVFNAAAVIAILA